MAKNNITQYDATAANNTDIDSINIDEGMAASDVNNAIRSLMSHLKNVDTGSQALTALSVTGNLTVDTDTLVVNSTNDKVGIGTTNPLSKLTIGGNANTTAKPTVSVVDTTDGGTMALRGQSPKLAFDVTSSGVPKILMDNAGAEFKSGTLDAEGIVHLKIDSNGHVTKPSQCGFLVHRNSTLTNFAKDQDNTLAFVTEVFDTNGDFSGSTFTAPVTGKYFLKAQVRFEDVDTAADYYILKIVTSGRSNIDIMNPDFSTDGDFHSRSISIYQNMDAGDTADVRVYQSGGTAQTDVVSSSAYTYFCGYLVN